MWQADPLYCKIFVTAEMAFSVGLIFSKIERKEHSDNMQRVNDTNRHIVDKFSTIKPITLSGNDGILYMYLT